MSSLRSAIVANYAGQAWAALMNIAFIPLYIRYLGIESYGLIGAFSVVLSCAMLLDAGLSPTLNREMAKYREDDGSSNNVIDLLRSVEIICALAMLLVSALGYLSADFIAASWLGKSDLPITRTGPAIFLMIMVAMMRVGEGIYRGALLGLGRHVQANVITILLATLRGAGAVLAIAFIAPTEKVFFLWQAAVSAVGLLILAISVHSAFERSDHAAKFSWRALRTIREFAGGIFLTTILSLMLTQSDKILLVRLLPLQQFAYYSLAATVANGLYQFAYPIAQSYYPRLTALLARRDTPALAACYHQGSQFMSVMVIPAAAVLIVCAPQILLAWTGKPEVVAASASLLSLLAAGTMLHAMMYMPYMLQLAAGWSIFALYQNMIAVAIIVPAILILVPKFGPLGAAGAWLALNVGYFLCSNHFMHRRLLQREMKRWYLKDVGAPLLGCLGAGLFMIALRPNDAAAAARLLWVAGFAVVVFLVAALSTRISRTIIISFIKQKVSA